MKAKEDSAAKAPTAKPRAEAKRRRSERTGQGSFVMNTSVKPFDVKGFCHDYDVARPDLTRLTGYSLRAIDKWAAGDKPSAAAQKQLKELARLFDALADLMESLYVGEWLKTPNDAFDGSSPLQVIERGESDRLWRMIYQLQAGESV